MAARSSDQAAEESAGAAKAFQRSLMEEVEEPAPVATRLGTKSKRISGAERKRRKALQKAAAEAEATMAEEDPLIRTDEGSHAWTPAMEMEMAEAEDTKAEGKLEAKKKKRRKAKKISGAQRKLRRIQQAALASADTAPPLTEACRPRQKPVKQCEAEKSSFEAAGAAPALARARLQTRKPPQRRTKRAAAEERRQTSSGRRKGGHRRRNFVAPWLWNVSAMGPSPRGGPTASPPQDLGTRPYRPRIVPGPLMAPTAGWWERLLAPFQRFGVRRGQLSSILRPSEMTASASCRRFPDAPWWRAVLPPPPRAVVMGSSGIVAKAAEVPDRIEETASAKATQARRWGPPRALG